MEAGLSCPAARSLLSDSPSRSNRLSLMVRSSSKVTIRLAPTLSAMQESAERRKVDALTSGLPCDKLPLEYEEYRHES
jgi:hypothetical protein